MKVKMNTSDDENEPTDPFKEKIEHLKRAFTLNDYLSCEETRDVLKTNHFQKYCDQCEKEIDKWYRQHCDAAKRSLSTAMYYDQNATKLGLLSRLVYDNIEKEYDLEVFYDDPILADSLVEKYDEIKRREEEEKRLRRLEILAETPNACKKFDWATKTYK